MAEPLKNYFGPEIPRAIARSISATGYQLDEERFLEEVLDGYETLGLMERGRRIATVLHEHLPQDFEKAIEILLASLPALAPVEHGGNHPMSSFRFLAHTLYVALYGVDHLEASLRAQHALTQLFTAEFSIRPFLERYPDATLARLREWAGDPNPRVRRLVSEGTRPRLPWAPRLRSFQADPRPVLELLELLKDDVDPDVRRSVANNLNDIGKDHPALLVETARAWMRDAGPDRRQLIRHALRSAVKRGDAGALQLLDFDGPAAVRILNPRITPARVPIGERVEFGFELANETPARQRVLVDCRVHFVKSRGETRPRVFRIGAAELDPGAVVPMSKSISLAVMTTRKPYPGLHRIELLLNGKPEPLGEFEVIAP